MSREKKPPGKIHQQHFLREEKGRKVLVFPLEDMDIGFGPVYDPIAGKRSLNKDMYELRIGDVSLHIGLSVALTVYRALRLVLDPKEVPGALTGGERIGTMMQTPPGKERK